MRSYRDNYFPVAGDEIADFGDILTELTFLKFKVKIFGEIFCENFAKNQKIVRNFKIELFLMRLIMMQSSVLMKMTLILLLIWRIRRISRIHLRRTSLWIRRKM